MHTLVVGGTGMLSGVTLWLAREGHVVSLVARTLAAPGHPFRLLHVRGSAAAHPDRPPGPGLANQPVCCTYQQVILGWKAAETGTRWLTHEEICAGVIGAALSDSPTTIVGVVRPWEQRPSY